MATSLKNLSEHDAKKIPPGKGKRFIVIVAEWNEDVTFALRDGAVKTLLKYGVKEKDVRVQYVPGTFELTYAAGVALKKKNIDAIICIGAVIQGETPHFDYICKGVAIGLSNLNAMGKKPVIFGVLTTKDLKQAIDRSGGKHGNKGVEAAVTALKMTGINAR